MPGQLFAVIGDANVRRNMTQMNMGSRQSMSTAKVIDCSSLSGHAQALREVPDDATVCVVQCLTGFLVSATDAGSVFSTIDPVLAEFNTTLRGFVEARHSVKVLMAPPMFHPLPAWYRQHFPEVAHQFSSVFIHKKYLPEGLKQ